MAFIFFWPACHVVLCVFIPGVPKNVSFPKLDWKMRLSVDPDRTQLALSDQPSMYEIQNLEMTELSKIKARKRLTIGHDTMLQNSLMTREQMVKQFNSQRNEVPSFIRVMTFIMNDMINCDYKYTKNYFYTMGWKIKSLLKMTVGYWDDELIRGFRIKERATVFDDDLDDDEEYHLDTIALMGQSHSLIWQFAHSTVVISKFAEAMNRSPLFVYSSDKMLVIEPLEVYPFDETNCSLPPVYRKLLNLYRIFDGRIWRCIFDLFGFGIEVALAINPHYLMFIIYWILIIPDRFVDVVQKWNEMNIKIPHLIKVMDYIVQLSLLEALLMLCGLSFLLMMTVMFIYFIIYDLIHS